MGRFVFFSMALIVVVAVISVSGPEEKIPASQPAWYFHRPLGINPADNQPLLITDCPTNVMNQTDAAPAQTGMIHYSLAPLRPGLSGFSPTHAW